MQRRVPILLMALTSLLVAGAAAEDVPLPVQKPKDSKGAAATDNTPPPIRRPEAAGATAKGGGAAKEQTAAIPIPPPAEPEKPKKLTEWPPADIEAAKARCKEVLKDVDAVALPEPPVRDGACGAPAPVRLVSLGKNPEVALDPPALLTCDMVAGLSKWLKGDLQPLAKKHFGREIVKITTMSDYACRNAYGRVGNKLSEHGKANALDIRSFVTAKGEAAVVLGGWGTIEREVREAKAAAEKAERLAAEKAAAEKAAAEKKLAEEKAAGQKPAGGTAATEFVSTRAKSETPRGTSEIEKGLGFASQRLGGPKEKDHEKGKDKNKDNAKAEKEKVPVMPQDQAKPDKADASKDTPTPSQAFLHDAHDAACRIFGTTLGPEANADHRNHFHVDMAPRKRTLICD